MSEAGEAEMLIGRPVEGKPARTALVTGGSRGIGRGIAFALAARGYDLAISHWQDRDNAKAVSERIEREFGRRCEVFEGNLEEEAEPARLAERAIGALGCLEVLVNNAGITLFAPIGKVDLMHVDRLYRIDFRAPMLLMQAVCTHMIEQGIRGRIVNIVSTRAERSYAGDAVYGGMKAALARATGSVALDVAGHGIRVNAVAPGAIKAGDPAEAPASAWANPAVPLQRSGTADDIGQAVAWLVSDEASYITGTTLRIDGGLIVPGTPH